MTNDFKDYLYYASESAMKEYRKTEESKRLSERAMKAYKNFENMLTFEFLNENLDALIEPESCKGEFLYFRGHLDFVRLLKTLGVI